MWHRPPCDYFDHPYCMMPYELLGDGYEIRDNKLRAVRFHDRFVMLNSNNDFDPPTNPKTFLDLEDELNQIIISWLVEDSKKKQGVDLIQDNMAIQKLDEAATKAKFELLENWETEINLSFLTADTSGPKHLVKTITCNDLWGLIEDYRLRKYNYGL